MDSGETDEQFLARLRPPFIKRADRERLAKMMAEEAQRSGKAAPCIFGRLGSLDERGH